MAQPSPRKHWLHDQMNAEAESSTTLLRNEQTPTTHKTLQSRRTLIIILCVSQLFWLIILLVALSNGCQKCRSIHSTDFVSRIPIPMNEIKLDFDDSLQFNDSSFELWRDIDTTSLQFTGEPSLLLDAAWDRLLWGEFPAISVEEISLNQDILGDFSEQDRNPQTGNFHIALNVFHSLHCVNAIRKELDKDVQDRTKPDAHGWSSASQRLHIDHCLNHIRQSLQCRPDLTPAVLKRHRTSDGGDIYIANAKTHSCYDWSKIREWMDERKKSALGAWENHHH